MDFTQRPNGKRYWAPFENQISAKHLLPGNVYKSTIKLTNLKIKLWHLLEFQVKNNMVKIPLH